MIPIQRLFCNANDKCYIIKTKDQVRKIVYGSEVMQKYREQTKQQKLMVECDRWNWERVIRQARQLVLRSQQHSVELVKRSKVQDKFEEFKNKQVELLREKAAKAPEMLKEQMEVIKASDGYKKAMDLPHHLTLYANVGLMKACYYYKVFAESPVKAYLDKIVIWLWANGKLYTVKIFQFIREAYFDKPEIKQKK